MATKPGPKVKLHKKPCCPNCQSRVIYFRMRAASYFCRTCGEIFAKKDAKTSTGIAQSE